MAWTLVGVGTVNTVTTTAPAPAIPAGAQEGDLLVSIVSARGSQTFTQPTGWSLATSQGSGNTSTTTTSSISSGALAYIVRGASAPSTTWTITTANVAMSRVMVYRNTGGTPTFIAATSATDAANTVTCTTGSITTDADDALIVAGFCAADNTTASAFDAATDPTTASGDTNTTTNPTNGTWIERCDAGSNSGADTALAIADAVRATSGSTGTIQVTSAASTRNTLVAAAFKVLETKTVVADPGNLNLEGGDAVLSKLSIYTVAADLGNLNLEGGDAVVTRTSGYDILADPGVINLDGGDAILTRLAYYSVAADLGSLQLSGGDATLSKDFIFTADPTLLSLIGGDAVVSKLIVYPFAADPGGIQLVGGDVSLFSSRTLTTTPSGLNLTGGDVTLSKVTTYTFDSQLGQLTLSGGVATIVYDGATPIRLVVDGQEEARGFIGDRTELPWWEGDYRTFNPRLVLREVLGRTYNV